MLPNAHSFHNPAVLCVSYRPLCHPGAGSKPKLKLEMETTLTAAHWKVVRDGSKDPAVEELAKTLNNVSVHGCARQINRGGHLQYLGFWWKLPRLPLELPSPPRKLSWNQWKLP